jgi:Class III cytochrome C family
VRGRWAFICAAIVAGSAAGVAAAPPVPRLPPRATPPVAPATPAAAPAAAPRRGAGDCSDCHTQRRWSEVTFDHAGTGFPLAGAHARASCRGCHAVDFRAHVPTDCASCHRDRHAGELGQRCEGCHEETSWRDTLFSADAHRRTAFPLLGRHGAIPCQECHGELRDRTFSRAPVGCVSCHAADYAGTAVRSIDHRAAGFSTDCQSCHATWAFAPARFAAHDACFRLSTGAHASLRCQQCHARVAGLVANGTCRTQSTTCASCHAHACPKSDTQHTNVMGYACVSQKCAECHQRL